MYVNQVVCEHIYIVLANSSFDTIFVSSTNSGIESCSGLRVIIGNSKKDCEAGCSVVKI